MVASLFFIPTIYQGLIHDGKHNDCDELYHKVTASLVGYPAVGGHNSHGASKAPQIGGLHIRTDWSSSLKDYNQLHPDACL